MIGNDGFSKAQARYDSMEKPEPTREDIKAYYSEEIESLNKQLSDISKQFADSYGVFEARHIESAIECLDNALFDLDGSACPDQDQDR